MHDLILLRDIVIIFTAVVLIIPLFHRFRIPTMLGFILAGVIIGPHATGLIADITDVRVLAEVGIVLLLFSIGMEVSPALLVKMWRTVVIGGGLQLFLTAGVVGSLTLLFGFAPVEAVFVGFLVSLGSTAIVIKLLYDRAETHTPQGRIILGILLFQDLAFVPLMLFIPMLSSPEGIAAGPIAGRILTAILAIAGIILAARYVFPWFINHALKTRSRELFVMVVVVLSLGTAWLSSAVGLSLALGAFVAGLGLSQSEFHHQIAAETAPLRDILGSLFFTSLGMLVDPWYVAANPLLLIGLALSVQVLKIAVMIPVALVLKTSPRVAVISAFSLAQVGEFSFLLAGAGQDTGLMDAAFYQGFFAVTLVSMLMTPLLLSVSPALGEMLQRVSPRPFARDEDGGNPPGRRSSDHVIILGYGLNGRNLATVLRETGLSYVVLELNAELYRKAVAEGHPAMFGDGTRGTLLTEAGISGARVLVVAISDPLATRMIIRTARSLNNKVFIITRTRYVSEVGDLFGMGADEVIPEEFETSIEIFTRVLREYHLPRNIISAQVDLLRREGYGLMRGVRMPDVTLSHLESILAAGTTDTFLVLPESHADGKSLLELDIRRKSGASILSIVRDGKPLVNPPPDTLLKGGDILVVIGTHRDVEGAFDALGGKSAEGP